MTAGAHLVTPRSDGDGDDYVVQSALSIFYINTQYQYYYEDFLTYNINIDIAAIGNFNDYNIDNDDGDDDNNNNNDNDE